MDFFEQLEKGRYGSFELKRQVGPNLLKGLLVSLVIHSTVIASPFIIARLFAHGETIPSPPVGTGPVVLVPPPLVPDEPKPLAADNFKPSVPDVVTKVDLVPVPASDADPIEQQPADQQHLKDKLGGTALPDSLFRKGSPPVVIAPPPPDETIPPPGKYVPLEIDPAPLSSCPQPNYPEIAKISGQEGRVTVQIYVDKHGDVKKWLIAKADPAGLGFEEEIAKVVPSWRFTPGIQGGNAVGAWVAVPFKFKVKK